MKQNTVGSLLIICFILFLVGAIINSTLVKNIIFLILSILLFMFIFQMSNKLKKQIIISKNLQYNCSSYVYITITIIIYIITIMILYNLLGLKYDNEGYRMLEINPATKCVGGPYTWGDIDSPKYKFCSSADVKTATSRLNCGKGLVGRPIDWNGQWSFTPESNSEWENERCKCMKNGNVNICECLNRNIPDTGVL